MNKILKISFGVVFGLFAIVQVNDPDPFIWVVLYGFVSAICFYAAFRAVPRLLVLLIVGVLLIFAITLSPHFYTWLSAADKSELFGEMIYDRPYIEGTREFLGLVIAIGALFYIYRKGG